jgi:hypothetical protein
VRQFEWYADRQSARPIAQATPCDYWGYGGGFEFTDLSPGVEMTLRASASGYADQELSVVPSEQRVVITLLEK